MLSVILLAVAAIPANPTWYVVGETPSAILAIDIASLNPSGQNMSLVEAQIFKRTLDTEYGPVRRIDQIIFMDCASGLATPKSIVVRKMNGEVATSTAPPDPKAFQSEAIRSLACFKKPLQASTGPFHLESILKTAGAN